MARAIIDANSIRKEFAGDTVVWSWEMTLRGNEVAPDDRRTAATATTSIGATIANQRAVIRAACEAEIARLGYSVQGPPRLDIEVFLDL